MNYHSIIFKIGELDKEIIEEKSSKHKHNEGHSLLSVSRDSSSLENKLSLVTTALQ